MAEVLCLIGYIVGNIVIEEIIIRREQRKEEQDK